MQLMALDLGGRVDRTGVSEFGKTELHVEESLLLKDTPQEQTVWMSHRDSVVAPPEGARVVAGSASTPIAAFEAAERALYGVQFHPEVVHTPHGMAVLKNFLYEIAAAPPAWTPPAGIEDQVAPQRGRVARRHEDEARRAAAAPLQGRGAARRRGAWHVRADGLAAALPGAGARDPHHRRRHARAPRDPPRRGRDPPGGGAA